MKMEKVVQEIKYLTVRLPKKMAKDLSVFCAAKGVSKQELITNYIKRLLS